MFSPHTYIYYLTELSLIVHELHFSINSCLLASILKLNIGIGRTNTFEGTFMVLLFTVEDPVPYLEIV